MGKKDDGDSHESYHEVEIGITLVAIILIVLVTFAGRYNLDFLF